MKMAELPKDAFGSSAIFILQKRRTDMLTRVMYQDNSRGLDNPFLFCSLIVSNKVKNSPLRRMGTHEH